MKRRDFLAWLPLSGLALASPAPAASETVEHRVPDSRREVDVKTDFGAKGDGVTDDWQAIDNAGRFLQARGGGRMYFPAGRYLLPTFARNIEVRNFIEYCGDGASSVIIGNNAGFTSPRGAIFGRDGYRNYRYFQARDIVAGDQSVTLAVAADGDKFSPGDIILARSVTAILSGDVLPHFVEMNRVIAVHGGVISLEDPIDDGWSGVVVANVTGDVAQGYSIHDLRIECEAGYPIFIQASYKSVIRNCWTLGVSVMTVNGFCRSIAHDIIARVLWSAAPLASLIEIETGSVRASLHDMEIEVFGVSPASGGFPLFYCQEFSRRTEIRNIRVAASSIAAGIVIQAFAGAHHFENIEIVARSIDKVLDYSCGDPAVFSLNHLPTLFKGISVETLDSTDGFNHGFILYNNHRNGTVENVTVQDCVINGVAAGGPEHNLIWLLRGDQRHILFDNVRGPADVQLGRPQDNAPDPLLDGVEIRNCRYRRLVSENMFDRAAFVNCRRADSRLPMAIGWPSTTAWINSAADRAMLTLAIPADATISRGDHIELKFSGWYADGVAAQVAVKAFGTLVMTAHLMPFAPQAIDLNLRFSLTGNSFAHPDRFVVTGHASVNDAIVPMARRSPGVVSLNLPGAVEMLAWSERGSQRDTGFLVEFAALKYVCFDE